MDMRELRELHRLCDYRTEEGTTPQGQKVQAVYKSKGNWDIFLDGKYVGTIWYS